MGKGIVRQILTAFLMGSTMMSISPHPVPALEPVFDFVDQGINENEEATAQQVIDILLAEDDTLDMIVTYRKYRDGQYAYQVYAKRDTDGDGERESGHIWFRRRCQDANCNASLTFEMLEESPSGFNNHLFGDPGHPYDDRKNPAGLATVDEEIVAGDNPNSYECFQDIPGDPRCAYIEPEDMPLPYVYERLTAALDEPRAGDLIVIAKAYSHGSPGHLGSHGHPGVVQSRTPLIMAGAGVKAGYVFNDPQRVPKAVDIAPTVAYLMGLPKVDGANFSGLTSSQRSIPPDVYLDRQDGEVLQEIYDLEEKIIYTYLIVIDGLRPQDALNEEIAPTLAGLIAQGNTTYWEQARAVMTTRTNANHAAMITGAYAETCGITGNNFCDPSSSPAAADERAGLSSHCTLTPFEDPSLLQAETLFQAIEAQRPELVTAAVFGKQKLADLLSEQADIVWGSDKATIFDTDIITGYAFDWRTMDEVLQVSQHHDPDFTFVNLADVDRVQHFSGPGSPEALATLNQTDEQLQRLIDYLRQSGKWERSVVIIAADHSFGSIAYNPQHHLLLKPLPPFQSDHDLVFLSSGGTNHLHFRNFDPTNGEHQNRLKEIRETILSTIPEGIQEVLYRQPNPWDTTPGSDLLSAHPDWHLDHERAGDLIVTATEDYSFCDSPDPGLALACMALPIMRGDHGGPGQRHIPLLITGGSALVDRHLIPASEPEFVDPVDDTAALPEQAENVDLAPTLAWLLGIDPPAESQGRILSEAFDNTEDPLEALGPYTPFVVLIISDGLSHTAVLNALYGNSQGITPPELDSDYGLQYLVENGVLFRYGSITNFPSVTYPSHNVVGSGAWSGHHGIVGNRYFDRETNHYEDPFNRYIQTEQNLRARPAVATLHEAVHDALGYWDHRKIPQGAFTASLNEPSTRGADFAVLELRGLPFFAFPTFDRLWVPYMTESVRPHSEGGDTDPAFEERGYSELVLYGIGDSFAQAAYRSLVEEPRLATPRFTNFNFTLTDGAGHADGPHGDVARAGIQDVDRRLSRMVKSVIDQGLFRKTLFILTSDHGMESQDPSRSGSYTDILDTHHIRYVVAGELLYLECMDMALDDEAFVAGLLKKVRVTVTDDDQARSDDGSLLPVPIAKAQVTLTNGSTRITQTTNAAGQADFLLVPSHQDPVTIRATHGSFNPRTIAFDVVGTCGCLPAGISVTWRNVTLQLAFAMIFFVFLIFLIVRERSQTQAG